jgi:hypothetical protein
MRKVFAANKFRAFYFSVHYLETCRFKNGGLDFCPLFCVSVNLACRHKISCCRWCLRVSYLGECLHRRQTKQQEDGENYTMRNLTILFCSKHIRSEINQLVADRWAKMQHSGDDSCIWNFSRKIWREERAWQTGVHRRIILKWISKQYCVRGLLDLSRWSYGPVESYVNTVKHFLIP